MERRRPSNNPFAELTGDPVEVWAEREAIPAATPELI